jgi:transcriptional regulator with XRE-family HTH domain
MNAILSATIAARYRESGMSYKEFAALLGVSIPQLYLVLRGVSNPPILTVVDLARRLALDPWILLGVRAPRTIRAGQPARGPGQRDERGG